MNKSLYAWGEKYLFFPNLFQRFISILLLPLTLIYMLITLFKRLSAKKEDFGLPVISIGNLIIGGSGKTPMAIALAQNRENVAIVLRGYGRESKGLYVISLKGEIKEPLLVSGDEARLLALSLPKATVIVAENRKEGIKKAKELGSKLVFLDDGFSKYDILKFDILLRPSHEPTNELCLPSGGYREPKMMYATANLVLQEDKDFKRVVNFKQQGAVLETLPSNIVVVTAISKPERLKAFLPENTHMVAFPDHYAFTQLDIDVVQKSYPGFSIVTTAKDFVKLEALEINALILMDLELEISAKLKPLEDYIAQFS